MLVKFKSKKLALYVFKVNVKDKDVKDVLHGFIKQSK